jgi:hypothetical protein
MNENEKRAIMEKYINSYITFDINAKLSVIHPEIDFKNISQGEVNATASGTDKSRNLADHSKNLFSYRRQTITELKAENDKAFRKVDYEATLAADLPNGMNAGETIHLNGRPEFTFRDGKIYRITDIS